jgi:hypothetical protein
MQPCCKSRDSFFAAPRIAGKRAALRNCACGRNRLGAGDPPGPVGLVRRGAHGPVHANAVATFLVSAGHSIAPAWRELCPATALQTSAVSACRGTRTQRIPLLFSTHFSYTVFGQRALASGRHSGVAALARRDCPGWDGSVQQRASHRNLFEQARRAATLASRC